MVHITDRTSVSIGVATVVLLATSLGVLAMPAAAEEAYGSESTEVTVSENGSVERVELVWGVDEETYSDYETYAELEGYDGVDAWYESLYEADDWIGNVSVTTSQVAGGYVFSVELIDVDTGGQSEANVTADGDTIVYEEFNITNRSADPNVSEYTYRVNMPGEITDSNAHEVRDDVAVWHLHEEHTSELFVEATVADSSDDDADDENESDNEAETSTEDTDDENDTDDEDGVPGFGSPVALVALCIAATLAIGRRVDR